MRSEDSERFDAASETSDISGDQSQGANFNGGEGEGEARPLSEGSDGGDVAGELEASREKYLRLAAEYDNYRKRTDRERLEARDRSQGQMVERLLDTLDDLQRVARLEANSTTIEALIEGVRLVERKLLRALEAEGLEPLEARGEPFDPSIHEALMTAPTTEPSEDHTVGEVFQTGYRFRGNLLRPARVQVRSYEG